MLAASLGVDRSYVARTLRLTSLAPDIVEAILYGEEPNGLPRHSPRSLQQSQPTTGLSRHSRGAAKHILATPGLSLAKLRKDLPVCWAEQRERWR